MAPTIDDMIAECTTMRNDMVFDGENSYMSIVEHFDKQKFAKLILDECQKNLDFHGLNRAVEQLEWLRKNHLGI